MNNFDDKNHSTPINNRMKPHTYDKAKWHYDGEFPEELDQFQGFIPFGMLIGWFIEHKMIDEKVEAIHEEDLLLVRQGKMSGAQFYERNIGGTFNSRDLTEEGNAFAKYYTDADKEENYFLDYAYVLAENLPSEYHVQDNADNYQKISEIISYRYGNWKSTKSRNEAN